MYEMTKGTMNIKTEKCDEQWAMEDGETIQRIESQILYLQQLINSHKFDSLVTNMPVRRMGEGDQCLLLILKPK